MNRSNYLSFLPIPSKCKSSDYIAIHRQDTSQMTSFQKDFLQVILEKFGSTVSSFQEYSGFRKALAQLDETELEFSSSTIVKLLQASPDCIFSTLEVISQHVDYYPEMERIYIQQDKKYQITPKQIQTIDCYSMLRILMNKISTFVRYESSQLFESVSEEAFQEVYDSYLEILKTGTEEQKNSLLLAFDQEFSFLKDTLYCDFYEKYRDKYGFLFLKCLLMQHRQSIAKRMRKEDYEYRTYVMHNFECKSKIDYNSGAYKVYKKRGKNHEILSN